VDLFIGSLQQEAIRKYFQQTIDGEVVPFMTVDDAALQQGTEKIVFEVFDHEINNLINQMRHTLYLSDKPAVPEDQWGAPDTPERSAFEKTLAQSWAMNARKLNQLKEALRLVHGLSTEPMNVADILDAEVQSAYVGIYIAQDMMYPHHLINVEAVKAISMSMQNVKRLFLARSSERDELLLEMNKTKARIGDFIDIFPDRHMYSMGGDVDRELNQFEINLFFEMLYNAKKYKTDPSETIEIFVSDTGQIDVKNRSKQKMDVELTAFGTRGGESLEQKGKGFGIFKMKAIAGMTGKTMEFSSDQLDGSEPPLYVITCSLKQAA
jgi:hypothetical protein